MRLINTTTFQLEDMGRRGQEGNYAILSHRWTDDEIDFDSYMQLDKTPLQSQQPPYGYNTGLGKVWWGCYMARQQQLQYFWIDTCCIRKTSSSELNRSIVSMFKWYADAAVCYAYLASATEPLEYLQRSRQAFLDPTDFDGKSNKEKRRPKEWFTRGWTLQELLDTKEMEILDARWNHIGSRKNLRKQIVAATNILPIYLNNFRIAGIAAKLSWASERETEEEEDRVYSLFGLFGVSIDVRYGEGGRSAFLRLQEEIIKNSQDESIFAWTSNRYESSGLLAPWLDCFKHSGDVFYHTRHRPRGPYRLTNQGLEFSTGDTFGVLEADRSLVSTKIDPDRDIATQASETVIHLVLYAWRRNPATGVSENITITLRQSVTADVPKYDFWERIDCGELGTVRGWIEMTRSEIGRVPRPETIYVPQEFREKQAQQPVECPSLPPLTGTRPDTALLDGHTRKRRGSEGSPEPRPSKR